MSLPDCITDMNITNTLASPDNLHCDVLIIGAGLAGLTTALSLPSELKVLVLSKKALTDCSSHYAQGGIAASLSAEDSVTDHLKDTLIAGDGLCDEANSHAILTDGAQAVAWLYTQGVPFTLNDEFSVDSNCLGASHKLLGNLHLTQEGGHGRRRVAHADDATGQYIMQTLHQNIDKASNITILTGMEALELITQPVSIHASTADAQTSIKTSPKDSIYNAHHCNGAIVWDDNYQQILTINSKAVVLASGGLGQLFKRATAPDVCMGDGMMMAWQAGCRLANLEFVQFHPTGLALDNSNFLISEAVRGEGGYLRCPITDERFMQHYDERLELAPRDIVARAIADQISQNGLGYVHLDISHQPADFIYQHFPKIAETLYELGIDMTYQPIPVAPTAHYTCGGVVATADGLTDVMGLYAAGEVAYTGLHGANRLASNSLLECVVMGRRIAQHLPTFIKQMKVPFGSDCSLWSAPQISNGYSIPLNPTPSKSLVAFPSSINSTDTADNALIGQDGCLQHSGYLRRVEALKDLMSAHLGIIRNQPQLISALEQLQQWQLEAEQMVVPKSSVDWLNHWRWQRLLTLTMLMLQSALSREESRGGHFRSDCSIKSELAQVSVIDSHTFQSCISDLLSSSPSAPSQTDHLLTQVSLLKLTPLSRNHAVA